MQTTTDQAVGRLRRTAIPRVVGVAIAAVGILSACSSDDDATDTPATSVGPPATPAPPTAAVTERQTTSTIAPIETSPTTSQQSVPETAGPPPMTKPPVQRTELEVRVIDALASLGISATTADHSLPANSAVMWAKFDDGTELYVNADLKDAPWVNQPRPPSERVINGVTVQRADGPWRGEADYFTCGDALYASDGAVPPGYDSFDDFLADLINAFGC